jgi:magnesium transporter
MLKALWSREGSPPVAVADEAELARLVREGAGCLWVDLENPTERERGVLERVFGFHKLAIENCLRQTSHPRLDDYGPYLYLVFHTVAPEGAPNVAEVEAELRRRTGGDEARAPRFRLQEIDAFLGRNFLVTYHDKPDASIDAMARKCAEVKDAMSRGPDRVLAEILDHLADAFVDVMERIDGEIEKLEGRLFRHAGRPALRELFSLKKDILHLRRAVNPQREVLNRLARAEHPAVTKEEAVFFRDVYDHIYRVSEMLESFRDVLTGALEVYLTVASNRLNEIMKVLTIVSIILMSTSLVAGLYGMNVPLPLSESRAAFWLILLAMAAISAGLLVVFRKRRWI